MHRCLISFGANIGDAAATVQFAAKLLRESLPRGDRVEMSRLFKTPPVGGPSGQAAFINAAAAVETALSPWEVWHVIRSIEQQLGRQRIRRWEARRIDLDILLYDHKRIWTPQLKIPHPRMCMRRFILAPCVDVSADWIDPVSGLTIQDLYCQVRTIRPVLVAGPEELPIEQAIQAATGHQAMRLNDPQQIVQSDRLEMSRQIYCCTLRQLELGLSGRHASEIAAHFGLIFVWVGAVEGAAWEDQHRDLAIQLRLSDEKPLRPSTAVLPFNGARYLLATADVDWAGHEIEAAMAAMDCTIEPLAV